MLERVGIEAVEYPTGRYPPIYIQFSLWEDTLTMLVDGSPSSGEQVDIYYTKLHTLDASGSTIPIVLEDLIVVGAAGYAAVEWASFATNRINVGGEEVWHSYLTWGQEQLGQFHKGLATHGRKNRVRNRRLYRPFEPFQDQTTVTGP